MLQKLINCGLIVLLLCSCASGDNLAVQRTITEQIDDELENKRTPRSVLNQLLTQAIEEENYPAVGKVLKRQCENEISQGTPPQDCYALIDFSYLNNTQEPDLFILAVEFLLTQNTTRLKQVLAADSNPETRFLAQGILTPTATHCQDPQFFAQFGGWRCYDYAKSALDEGVLKGLRRQYQSYGALHKVADVEFLLAKLYAKNNKTEQAKAAASKAAIILAQLGNTKRANAVRQWREALL